MKYSYGLTDKLNHLFLLTIQRPKLIQSFTTWSYKEALEIPFVWELDLATAKVHLNVILSNKESTSQFVSYINEIKYKYNLIDEEKYLLQTLIQNNKLTTRYTQGKKTNFMGAPHVCNKKKTALRTFLIKF